MTDTNKMMIAFEVISINDFARQVNAFLSGSGLAVVFAGGVIGTAQAIAGTDLTERPFGVSQEDWLAMSPEARASARRLAIAKSDTAIAEKDVSTPNKMPEPLTQEPAKEEKPAKAPSKRGKKAEPQPEPSIVEPEKPADIPEADLLKDVEGNDLVVGLEAQKIKDEVLGQLRDLYAAGRVKVVRGLLEKYGGGAKSLPEVEPGRFVNIREALKKGVDA